jgi:hypothetical protein
LLGYTRLADVHHTPVTKEIGIWLISGVNKHSQVFSAQNHSWRDLPFCVIIGEGTTS